MGVVGPMDDFIQRQGPAFLAHILRRLADELIRGAALWYPEAGVTAPPRTASTLLALDTHAALGVTEIVTDLAFYNYEAKYSEGGSRHIVPADVKPKIYDKVQKMALKAHAALGCRGVSRTDFRFNDRAGEDGELVCLEINTQPGMTETSLVPEQARHAGHSFPELVAWMVEDASCSR